MSKTINYNLICSFTHLYLDIVPYFLYIIVIARIAQLVEQWIEDPRVTSSNLVLGIEIHFNSNQ